MRVLTSVVVLTALGFAPSTDIPRATLGDAVAIANDNRTPAGARTGDTLSLRLTVGVAAWQIFGDSAPPFRVLAFSEEGKAPSIPGPLVRVPVGTAVHVVIHNPLDDTLTVRGFSERGALDSLVIPPMGVGEARFVARRAGTYQYWGATAAAQRLSPARVRGLGLLRSRFDSQLAGALVIDPPGKPSDDRIFVITELSAYPPNPSGLATFERHGLPVREFTALNGRSWPNTERLQYALGDSVRWRIVNTSFQTHPMHLHGFYFRVDSRGSARIAVDSIYPSELRRMAVTEPVGPGETMTMVWTPDRPGGWIFHCHLTMHVAKMPKAAEEKDSEFPAMHEHGDPDQHVVSGMNGMVLGINVVGAPNRRPAAREKRRLRLFVQSDSAPNDTLRRFGYVLQRDVEPTLDSLENPGPVLVLTRGQPTTIEVVNRTAEATAVHWHGIELESYYDGAVGWGGMPDQRAPAIRPGSSFDVHITPKRAGTFMYHTHFNELVQQLGGLVGMLVVLEPGEAWNPARELVVLVSDGKRGAPVINGGEVPAEKELRVGTTYRLRLADIAVFQQNLWVRILRDSSLVTWRAVAKDGFTLPPLQATMRSSLVRVTSGETADFELTPDVPGDLTLEIGAPPRGPPVTPFRLEVLARIKLRVVGGTP